MRLLLALSLIILLECCGRTSEVTNQETNVEASVSEVDVFEHKDEVSEPRSDTSSYNAMNDQNALLALNAELSSEFLLFGMGVNDDES